jgi:ATP-binding cassette subfamily D (ALD) protein 3
MGIFNSMLVKYGATLVAYAILGLPVFGPNRAKYIARVGTDASTITRDYIRNSSLLINLAKAIGRIVVSYKDVQQLAGYTSLVAELEDVLADLSKGNFTRNMLAVSKYKAEQRGQYVNSHESIRFDKVPVVTPNGEVLIRELDFEIKPGMHVFIKGPNGCGKSSLFRILAELWPLFGGKVHKPPMDQIFYVPQRPYLPVGSLRDQVIYPDTKTQMVQKGYNDEYLQELLTTVYLPDLADKRGGLDKEEEWNDTLSGGQKQRVALARLMYHSPKYAILDECTSAISMEAEGHIYQHFKSQGITLLTVSQREVLAKYHDFIIDLDGEGGSTFSAVKSS